MSHHDLVVLFFAYLGVLMIVGLFNIRKLGTGL